MAIEYWFTKSVLDSDWAGHAFRITPTTFTGENLVERMKYTTSSGKFTDSSLGGSFEANPLPQFTRNCDYVHKSMYSDSKGVGRWKSEVLDDNMQVIHIRAGVPTYNDMFTFFTNFFHMKSSIMSRRGRGSSAWYEIGKVAGTIITLPLQPFILGASFIKYMLNMPRTKYYYLKPAMHMYRRAVASMMGTYMVEVGLTTLFDSEENKEYNDPARYGTKDDLNAQLRVFGKASGLVTKSGAFDIFAISTRAERLAQLYRARLNKAIEGIGVPKDSSREDYVLAINSAVESTVRGLPSSGQLDQTTRDFINSRKESLEAAVPPNSSKMDGLDTGSLLEDYFKIYGDLSYGAQGLLEEGDLGAGPEMLGGRKLDPTDKDKVDTSTSTRVNTDEDGNVIAAPGQGQTKPESIPMSWWSKLTSSTSASINMGAEFVSFRINPTGTHSETFSNSYGESGLMETINSNSAQARAAKFNIAEGNIAGGLGSMIQVVTETMAGVLDSAGMSGLFALGGSAFIDIQKIYQNSSVDMMTTSVTIPLRAWSADPWTIAKDIAYPLFSILALGMPKSTGSQSYDEPFLLEVFLRGRSQMRECRVRSISVTRGVGDIGWTKDGHAIGVDVTIELEDMSGVIGVPINPDTSRVLAAVSGGIGAVADVLDSSGTISGGIDAVTAALDSSSYSEDTKFGDYMNVLGAVNLHNQINTLSGRLKLNLAKTRASMEQWRSPSAFVSAMGDTLPGIILQAIGKPMSKN